MFERIVVGLDGSRAADAALELAARLATAFGSAVDLVSVVEDLPPYVSARREEAREAADARRYYGDLLRAAETRLRRRGIRTTGQIRVGNEVRRLVEAVVEQGADLVAIGHAGHSGAWGGRLGSTAARVLDVAPSSVLVARSDEGPIAIERILVGYDGSSGGTRAVDSADAIAAVTGAHLVVAAPRELRELADPRYSVAAVAARAGGHADEDVAEVAGDAGRRLVELARQHGASLTVLGSTGRSHPWSPSVGPTAIYVAEHVPGSVLVVRGHPAELTAGRIMRRRVITARPETALADAVSQIVTAGVRALPVVDAEGHPIGIITLGDLLRRSAAIDRPSLLGTLPPGDLDAAAQRLAEAGGTCADVMSRPVVTCTPSAVVPDVLAAMSGHRVKRIVVVDDANRLVGIVSRADVLRALAGSSESPDVGVRRRVTGRTVGEVMRTDVARVRASASLEEAARAVLRAPGGRVAVVDDADRVVGVLAVRDLLPLAARDRRREIADALGGSNSLVEPLLEAILGRDAQTTAGDLMRREVVTTRPDAPIAEVLQTMMSRAFKGVLVTDAEGRLVGVIGRWDIVRALSTQPAV